MTPDDVLDLIDYLETRFAELGHLPGIIACRWARIGVEQCQGTGAHRFYWMVREGVGSFPEFK